MKKTQTKNTEHLPVRADGLEARTRLMRTALRLFAEHGYAKTSTRELARVAEVNISAISYYFGDKAGLYRAVFNDPNTNPMIDPAYLEQPDLSLEQGLRTVILSFTDGLKQEDVTRDCIILHCREMLEPTGLWQEEIEHAIKPAHAALVKFLCRHLHIKRADDAVHRLAFALAGLPLSLMMNTDVILAIRPNLLANHRAINAYTDVILQYALAMCEVERQRRQN